MTKIEQKIPEGWSVKKMGELGVFSKGKGITKNELSLDGYPCIRYAEIYTLYNFTVNKCYSFISKETSLSSKAISSGCLLLAGSGETKEEIGKCVAYIGAEKVFVGGDTIVFAPNFKQIFPIYLSYFLNTVGRKQLNRLGQGDSIVHIHSQNLEKVKFLLPPLPEQEKIAGILSCWDDGIEKLSALIEKKKIQKKALMQQLLSGKHRLKDFSSPWHEKYLVDICDFNKGQQLNKADMLVNGQYPVLNGGISYSGYTNEWNTKANMITISEGGNSCGFVSFIKEKFWCGGHCYSIFDIKTDTMFLYHLLKYNENSIMNLRVGSGLPNIQISSLHKFKVFIPTDLAEQKAIAEILSKADEEIELLNKKLDVFKQEKKALMQQLLTGKIRVKVN